MSDLEGRLARCFTSVFPSLNEATAQSAALDSVAGWDSIAAATLLSVVCEEFDLPMDAEGTEDLLSFPAYRQWVLDRLG